MLRLDLAELRIDKARTCVGGFEVGATLIVDRQQDAVAIAVRQIGGRTVSFELRRFERHGVLPTPQQRDIYGVEAQREAVRELEFRSEARRVGKEWVSTCRTRWSSSH